MAYHPFRNLGLKLMAVVLATALWFIVAGEQQVERAIRVPLEFRNKPAHLEIVGEPPATVDIRVVGSSAILSRLDPGELVAVVDLVTARAGSRLFHMRTDSVRVPYGVEVQNLTPSTISLALETSLQRTLKVTPAVEGEPAPGFVTGAVTSDPVSVDVIGPESHVRALAAATTEPVSIAGARANVQDTVTIGVTDGAVRLVEPRNAAVTVRIDPAPIERELSGVPVRSRNLAPGYTARVAPRVVQVTVRGGREAVEEMRAEGVDAFVDLAGLGPGPYNLRVQFDPTQNFGVSATAPAVVKVTIK
jgi:YbbR domain-containing protein